MDPDHTVLEQLGAGPAHPMDIAHAALILSRSRTGGEGAHLDQIAAEARVAASTSLEAAADPADRVAVLATLFTRHGYRGDTETYDNEANADLAQVIARRRGLPVSLGILWLHAARSAGWRARGLDMPGHFLVALEDERWTVAVDVFAGGVMLDAPALRTLFKRAAGEAVELRPGSVPLMTDRAVLLRLQNNIKVRRLKAGDIEAALAVVEDMLRFAPDAVPLWREAGLMNQRLDRPRAAIACLDRFLSFGTADEAAARTRETLAQIKSRLN